MSTSRDILRQAADLADAGQPFVMVTVTNVEGSTPRDCGAKMLWSEQTGLLGTVGGGEFEHMVSASAEDHARARTCGSESFTLGRDAGQCCGGRMEVFFEFLGPSQRLVIFGAGHVSKALADAIYASPLEIVIVDDRPEWNSQERFPRCRCVESFDEGISIAREHPSATLTCVMTCSHDRDYEIIRALLESPPAFIGLIGSKTKRASFFSRLATDGVTEDQIKTVHCPIGLGDMGKEPELVAISIAGELLLEAKNLATL